MSTLKPAPALPLPAPSPPPFAPPAPTPKFQRRARPGDFVEGEAITSAILKHSGVKAPRPVEIPPRSFSSHQAPSPERKTLQFESTSPVADLHKPPSSAHFHSARSAEIEPERVRYVNAPTKDTSPNIEDDVRYHDYFNPPRFLPQTRAQPPRASTSASPWPKWTILGGVAFVLVGVAAAYVSVFLESIPFCDSNATTSGATATAFCHPCPEYGICFSGDLHSCRDPYLRVERACLEPSTVSRDADLMTQLLPRFLVKRATSTLCNATVIATLLSNESSKPSQVVTNALDLRNYLLHQAMWDEVDAAVFNVTFNKAMRQLKELHPEFYYTADGDVVLHRDDVEMWCALQLHLCDHVEVYAAVLVVVLTILVTGTWQRRRRATESQIKRLVHAVHVALKQPSNDLVDGAVAHLRHTLWGGKADHTWQRVVQAIHDDARIRERYILHRGQQVLIWEWIGTRRDDRNILRGQPVELVD
ncbi:hypothetical protein, variant [Aphanomyces invadans]|nr:hypothetical protein, variant [Aphanomyces invadans]ETV98731.1 hypothetical protein, variant [Aphanomyces invadans]|eukprot:XP_008872928.1 hypothetical protein, variant [Aphanomyces invadans]